MLKQFTNIKTEFKESILPIFLLVFIINVGFETKAQSFGNSLNFGFRVNLNMSSITGSTDTGLKLGATAGIGIQYEMNEKSSLFAELLYSTGGNSSSKAIDTAGIKVKIYDKIHLNNIVIPIVYQYYFTDILGLEIGPQLGFCLGGKEKARVGNESWTSVRLNSSNYNIVDFGIITGIFTKNITQEDNLYISLRAYFGLTNVMKDKGANKNISIQLGVGYIIGR